MAQTYQRRNTKRKRRIQLYLRMGIFLLVVITLFLGIKKIIGYDKYTERKGADIDKSKPEMAVRLLTVNPYSRPGENSGKIKGIVIHYTANPGSTAMQNRDYFEGLKDTHKTKASSHFVIGIDGEIVQCIPTWEIAYASNNRNSDTVSIETCHPTEDGSYTEETYQSMVQLTAWLCKKFDLTEKDVIRHFDVTGKNCPKYFVEHEDAWKQFLKDVKKAM